tara:strand:+ start:585 stop:977 length:393 start_codon:yes stop_codon:yes gene_type:complete
MSISIITLTDGVVTKGDVNTQTSTERVDIPTHEEELALLVYEEDFRQPELAKFLVSAKSREEEIWEEEEFRAQDRAVITPAVYDFEAELQRREESDVPNAQDHAMKTALSNGFTIDESSDGITRWEHLNA